MNFQERLEEIRARKADRKEKKRLDNLFSAQIKKEETPQPNIPQLLNQLDKEIQKKFEEFLTLARETKKLNEDDLANIYSNFMRLGELFHLMELEREEIRKNNPHLNKLFDCVYQFYFNELWSSFVKENRKNALNEYKELNGSTKN